MDMSQYLEIFIDESKEHLESLNQSLLQLESNPEDMDMINEIFRAAHTLKGMAGTMGFTKMQTLTHDMENVFQALRNSEFKVNSSIVDILFKCLDVLEGYVDNVVNTGEEGSQECNDMIKALNDILQRKNEATESKPESVPEKAANVTDAEQKPEESKEAVENNGFKLVIDEYAQNAVNKALNLEMNAFEIIIELNKSCVLKSARAFLIFQTLEKLGDVIKSSPKVEDIEDEKFDFSFSVALVTSAKASEVDKAINDISEIQNVTIKDIPKKEIKNAVEHQPQSNQATNGNEQNGNNVNQKNKPAGNAGTHQATKPKSGKTVRVDIDRLDNLMNLVSELIIIKTRLGDIKFGAANATQNYNESIEYLERTTTSLHDAVMKVRMVPVERVFNRFPRLIRDLSRELNKDIELIMSGEETEVDRNVIDEIGDPLMHLLRNSADHGIEMPNERTAAGKPEQGTIYLKAYHDGNNVVVEVQDDGAGINISKIRKKAIEKGTISIDEAEAYTQKDWINLLFKPSFSTADKITDISGRGVGLDVVKTKIESLDGIIEVETEPGKGSRFIIRLPLTLAIIQALLVQVSVEKYAIPLSSIKQIIDIESDQIKHIQGQEVILLRNQVIPLIRLEDVLEVEKTEKPANRPLTIVIVKKSDRVAGLIIDELIGQQDIVIKTLGKYLAGIDIIAGATILGDGQVALILDINSLL